MTLVTFTDYAIPNVSIDVETVQRGNLVSRVVEDVRFQLYVGVDTKRRRPHRFPDEVGRNHNRQQFVGL